MGTIEKTAKKTILTYLEKLPQRWVVTIMSTLGITMAFTMRACLCLTMTQMVKPVRVDSREDEKLGVCPVTETTTLQAFSINRTSFEPQQMHDNRFTWDEEIQGMVLSAFYYGYIITHIPGGVLAQRFGGKFILAYTLFSTSTLTLLTPTVARMGPTYLMVLRFIEGLGEGVAFPALCTIMAQWIPPHETGKLSNIVFSGVPIGNIIANFFGGLIIDYVPGGWPNVFYFFGVISLLWLGLWLAIVYNDPHSHPFISEEERGYLRDTIGHIERDKYLAPTPWKAILSTPAVWALIIAEVGFDWGCYTIVNDLPKYMNDVLRFSVEQNGLSSSTPYLAQWIVSIISSVLADITITRQIMTTTGVRKLYGVIGTLGPGLGVMGASFVGCDKVLATAYFTLGMALMGFCYPSIRVNALDLSPNYSATIMALVNGFGCLSGMATPYVVGLLTPNRTIFEWRLVFWIMLLMLAVASTIFAIFGSGELQTWDDGETLNDKTKPGNETKQHSKIMIIVQNS